MAAAIGMGLLSRFLFGTICVVPLGSDPKELVADIVGRIIT